MVAEIDRYFDQYSERGDGVGNVFWKVAWNVGEMAPMSLLNKSCGEFLTAD